MNPPAPRRRGRANSTLVLVESAARILDEIRPATVRAVCYRLFVEGRIESMSKACTNKVSRVLRDAREAGDIPWGAIVDETREAERVSTWREPDQIIDAAVRGYRRDAWQDQPRWVEVWSEKGTVRGTLAPVLDKFGVTFRVMHGYGSATALHSIAEETRAAEKPLTVLYVGDWDPSGLHMSEVDLPARLERCGGLVDLRRVALLHEDIAAGLPSFNAETKALDPRFQWFTKRFGRTCWELDALSPVSLRQRIEEQIAQLLDLDAWRHAATIEAAQVDSMKAFQAAYLKSRHASNCSAGAT